MGSTNKSIADRESSRMHNVEEPRRPAGSEKGKVPHGPAARDSSARRRNNEIRRDSKKRTRGE